MAQTQSFTASTTWTVPRGVTSVDAECWGAGGGGGGYDNIDGWTGTGGGGGAYSKKVSIAVTPGQVLTVTVGTGGTGAGIAGTGQAGGDSWFIGTSTVLAKGGSGGHGASQPSGTPGGAAASGVGDTRFSGGTGSLNPSASGSGGGGGGAGSTGNGGACGAGAFGSGTTVGGGNGGQEDAFNAPTPGSAAGGGGAGGTVASTGGNSGANGRVDITYTPGPLQYWPDFLASPVGPFRASNGALYSPFPDDGNSFLRMWKSTDSGATWAEVDNAHAPAMVSTSGIRSVSGLYASGSVYVAYLTAATTAVVQPFNTATDTWGTATAAATVATSNSVAGSVPLLLARKSAGDYLLVYQAATVANMGTNYRRLVVRAYSSAAWGTPYYLDTGTTSSATTTSHFDLRSAVLGASDRLHIFYSDSANSALVHRSVTFSGTTATFDTAASLTLDATRVAYGYLASQAFAWVNGSSTEINVPYIGTDGALKLLRFNSAANPTLATGDAVSAASVTNPDATGVANPGGVYQLSGTKYVVWPNATALDLYYDNDGGTNTYGADAPFILTTTNGMSVGDGSVTTGIGVLYEDSTGAVFYAELSDIPGAPAIGMASGVNGQAEVYFTAPVFGGFSPITSYTAIASPGGQTGVYYGAGNGRCLITGLANGTAYTFTVYATNSLGISAESAASNSVTPMMSTGGGGRFLAGADPTSDPGFFILSGLVDAGNLADLWQFRGGWRPGTLTGILDPSPPLPLLSATTSTNYPRNFSSSVTPASTVARLVGYGRTITAQPPTATTLTRIVAANRTVASSATPATTLTKLRSVPRTLTSAVTPTSTLSRLIAYARALSSTVTPQSTLVRLVALLRTLNSAATVSTTLSGVKSGSHIFASTITPASTMTRLIALSRTLSSTVTVSSALSRAHSAPRTFTSSATPASTLSAVYHAARSFASAVTPNSALTRLLTLARTLASSATVLSTFSRQVSVFRSFSSSVTPLSTLTRIAAMRRTLSSSVTVLTTLSTGNQRSGTFASSVSVASTLSRVYGAARTFMAAGTPQTTLSRVYAAIRAMQSSVTASSLLATRRGTDRTFTSQASPQSSLSRITGAVRALRSAVSVVTAWIVSGFQPPEPVGPIIVQVLDDGLIAATVVDRGILMTQLLDDGVIVAQVADTGQIMATLTDEGIVYATISDNGTIYAVLEDGMDTFELKIGATWKHLKFVISDKNGPVPLTGYTSATFSIRRHNRPDQEVVTAQPLTINTTTSTADYDFIHGAPNEEGMYDGDAKIIMADGSTLVAPVGQGDYIPISVKAPA